MPAGTAELFVRELAELGPLLEPLNWDLTLTGFNAAEIDALFVDFDDKADPADTVPALDEAPVSRGGDLWHLGDHRLLAEMRARVRMSIDWWALRGPAWRFSTLPTT